MEHHDSDTQETTSYRNPYALPAAIIVGFALIALAIYFGGNTNTPSSAKLGTNSEATRSTPTQPRATGQIRPIDDSDWIRGNPNAPIVIIEYSDYDCPFCKNFHETMNLVIDNYGTQGQVAWVHRHFPIEGLHPSAKRIAAAAECAGELGGTDAFWTFSDLVFGERGTNEPTNIARLNEFATRSGVAVNAFEECLNSGRTMAKVEADYADAINAGAEGTPYSLVLVGDQRGVINGAQPYSVVSQIIQTLLGQIRIQNESGV